MNYKKDDTYEFENKISEPQRGLIAEFIDFLVHRKKWWLTPIIVVILIVSLLVIIGGSGAAPFIYTLF